MTVAAESDTILLKRELEKQGIKLGNDSELLEKGRKWKYIKTAV